MTTRRWRRRARSLMRRRWRSCRISAGTVSTSMRRTRCSPTRCFRCAMRTAWRRNDRHAAPARRPRARHRRRGRVGARVLAGLSTHWRDVGMTTDLVPYGSRPPASMDQAMSTGKIMAQSGFFADSRDAAQAIVKILAGAELGFGPVASMTGIYIVKGRVTISANLMAAAIKRSGRYNYRVTELTDTTCEIAFFENGQSCGTSRFTTADADRAGLKTETWRAYPR